MPVCLSLAIYIISLRNQWSDTHWSSDNHQIWHSDCLNHENASRVNYIDLKVTTASQTWQICNLCYNTNTVIVIVLVIALKRKLKLLQQLTCLRAFAWPKCTMSKLEKNKCIHMDNFQRVIMTEQTNMLHTSLSIHMCFEHGTQQKVTNSNTLLKLKWTYLKTA